MAYENGRARVAAKSAAAAHRECVENDKKGAQAANRSRRTHHRWKSVGFGSPLYAAQQYILAVSDPFRAMGSVMAAAKQAALKKRTTQQLKDQYWELLELRSVAQAEVSKLLSTAPHQGGRDGPLDIALAEERAAGLSAEIAGLLRELQSRPGSPTPWDR